MRNLIVKSLALILFFSFVIINLSSCNNIGFKDVASVTYTSNGKTKTEVSNAHISLGHYVMIEKEEYESANSKYKFNNFDGSLSVALTPSSKKVTSIDGITDADNGNYIYEKFYVWQWSYV